MARKRESSVYAEQGQSYDLVDDETQDAYIPDLRRLEVVPELKRSRHSRTNGSTVGGLERVLGVQAQIVQ